ncbi:MAG: hypothetical protein H6P99_862 [Holophagaceae bacterium]|nr:hypothetical protein [Holophagaceae bacterium]
MKQTAVRLWVMAAGLLLLIVFACYLSIYRIYQVDEAQNLFMIRVLGTHQTGTYFSNALLWMLGPFAWGAASASTSAGLFLAGRLVFMGVFLFNLLLLAVNSGVRLRSERGLAALLGAASLAPLWDYGFEVRHDNLILSGLLLMWWLGRTRPRGRWSYTALGFLGVTLLFVAFKSFAYVVPLTLAFLLFPPPGHGRGRLALAAAWLAGASVAGLTAFIAYQSSGLWPVFLAGLQGGKQVSEGASRFGAMVALGRLPGQTPLLLGLAAAGLLSAGWTGLKQGWEAATWEGLLPEALLCLGAFGVLLVNPTPFPYNLVNLVPFLFLLAFRFAASCWDAESFDPRSVTLAAGVLVFTHFLPFGLATWRHLDLTNDRQETLMRTAESMTDPAKDPVYDAIGMVPTRPTIGFHWYLHSLNIQAFLTGNRPSVPQMLTARPATVLIPSYRTEWLPETDRRFFQSRYVPLADDFWVLGAVLPPGGGSYEVVHPGRYFVAAVHSGGKNEPLAPVFLDGLTLKGEAVPLSLGTHAISCAPGTRPMVVWLGPRLNQVPNLGRGDHLRLFVNWY